MNSITSRIARLMDERGWTAYRLEQESGVPAPTIRRWLSSEMYPTIPLLLQICDSFNLSLVDLLISDDTNLIELTPEKKRLHDDWISLSPDQQDAIKSIIKSYKTTT